MPKLIDLTGKRFGRWVVLKKAPSRNKQVYWLCQCDCGTIKEVKGQTLREGESISCGCYQKERAKETMSTTGKKNIKNILGQIFGDLTVIALSEKRSPNGHVYWKCRCSCGNEIEVPGNRLVHNGLTHCGCKTVLSRGEEKIRELLLKNNIPFQQQKTFNNCRYLDTNQPARFDFWVNNKYLIEFDGSFHFIPSGYWATPEKVAQTKEHDNIKNQWCKDNNIVMIRIPYTYYDNLCIEDLLPETSKFII